jgi:hypothetical protein
MGCSITHDGSVRETITLDVSPTLMSRRHQSLAKVADDHFEAGK